MADEAAWRLRRSLFGARTVAATRLAPTITEILRDYRFSRYEFRTLYAGGVCTQASMLVEDPADSTGCFIVTCRIVGDDQEWQCQCPRFRKDEGVIFIEPVKARIGTRRADKAVN